MMQYPIMECFYSIQGEGAYQGQSAYFIRLGGCDVGCVWCDVKDSWDADAHPQLSVEELVSEAAKYPSRIVILTGGEPAMYNLEPLTTALKQKGFRVHIETSGAYPLKGSFDWITFSPKKFKAPLTEVAILAHELKVIVFNKSDFAWAESFQKIVAPTCRLYLQPEWDKRDIVKSQIFEYVLAHPDWQISLQTHKFLEVD